VLGELFQNLREDRWHVRAGSCEVLGHLLRRFPKLTQPYSPKVTQAF
jgi:hypothetical protein